MKGFIASSIVLVTLFNWGSCLGPKQSVKEKNALIALSNIQQSLENNASYEHFIELLDQAKIEIALIPIFLPDSSVHKSFLSVRIDIDRWPMVVARVSAWVR